MTAQESLVPAPDRQSEGVKGWTGEGVNETITPSPPHPLTPSPLHFSARVRAYLELTKPRLATLIMLVASAGFCLGSPGDLDGFRLMVTILSVGLLAGGIFTLNHYIERDLDAVMRRTETRPLPTGRLNPGQALWFGITLSVLAVAALALLVNLLSGALALFTFVSYLFLYTPLKTKTPLCTLVGAFPGAMPPLLGWAAARGELGLGAWVLFAIVFLWQFPHFLAIGWLYREDYARAGIRMLPVIEPNGKVTGRQIVACTLTLLPVSLLPTLLGVSGLVYLCGAFVLGIVFLYLGARAAVVKSKWHARRLLLASVFYLPLLFALMVLGK